MSLLCSSTFERNNRVNKSHKVGNEIDSHERKKPHPRALTSSLKENKCGFHQKTFRVDEGGKGWAGSTPRTALTSLCASLKLLQPLEMDKSLKTKE